MSEFKVEFMDEEKNVLYAKTVDINPGQKIAIYIPELFKLPVDHVQNIISNISKWLEDDFPVLILPKESKIEIFKIESDKNEN